MRRTTPGDGGDGMIVPGDWERLQGYLDGELAPEEETLLERRLVVESDLADALISLGREERILVEWARAAAEGRRRAPAKTVSRRTIARLPGRPAIVYLSLGLLAAGLFLAVVLFAARTPLEVDSPSGSRAISLPGRTSTDREARGQPQTPASPSGP